MPVLWWLPMRAGGARAALGGPGEQVRRLRRPLRPQKWPLRQLGPQTMPKHWWDGLSAVG